MTTREEPTIYGYALQFVAGISLFCAAMVICWPMVLASWWTESRPRGWVEDLGAAASVAWVAALLSALYWALWGVG